MNENAQNLLNILHRGGPKAYLWTTPGKKTHWYDTTDPVPDAVAGLNTYAPVHPCTAIPETSSKGKPITPEKVRGRVEHVAAVNTFFADMDDNFYGDDHSAVRDHIENFDLEYSALTDSGGGFYPFYILDEPWILETDNDRSMARAMQAKFVERIGGDPNAKDLARVLRVPGSVNHKYIPSRPVELLHLNGTRHTLDAIKDFLGPIDLTPKRKLKSERTEMEGVALAAAFLPRLSKDRLENYMDWLLVGMALHELGDIGLSMWTEWSKGSKKYRPGEPAQKWETFVQGDDNITLASLEHWAGEDSATVSPLVVPVAPNNPKAGDYMLALDAMGWSFKMNETNDDIEVNGIVLIDPLEAVIRAQLRDFGYRRVKEAEDAYVADAYKKRKHPIKEYLSLTTWNGKDHIAKLASFFKDDRGVFPEWLRSFLIGAVGRVMENGAQNRMLVLEGAQDLGKSFWVRWLASPLPSFHLESSIDPDDKDSELRLMSIWLWEVAELGATMRKSDREKLKQFISREKVRVRKAYGKRDTVKPALSSFIGTVNDEAGFLMDSTGYRRFMVAPLREIDWDYTKHVDVNQLWAQAYALWDQGEEWRLTLTQNIISEEIAKEYEMEDPVALRLETALVEAPGNFIPTIEFLTYLKGKGATRNENWLTSAVARYMKSMGYEKIRRTIDGNKIRGYVGAKWTSEAEHWANPSPSFNTADFYNSGR